MIDRFIEIIIKIISFVGTQKIEQSVKIIVLNFCTQVCATKEHTSRSMCLSAQCTTHKVQHAHAKGAPCAQSPSRVHPRSSMHPWSSVSAQGSPRAHLRCTMALRSTCRVSCKNSKDLLQCLTIQSPIMEIFEGTVMFS